MHMENFKSQKNDYLLDFLISNIDNKDLMLDTLGVNETLIPILKNVSQKGEPYGDGLTISYMKKFYLLGLSFSEIGKLKGITEDGVRYNIKTLYSKKEWSQIKYTHYLNRRELKDKILYCDLKPLIASYGLEETSNQLGYKQSYLDRLWKQLSKKYEVILIEG